MMDGSACILVVDDDENARTMLVRRLGRNGFDVLTAAGGAEALERLPTIEADLLLLDVEMPGMNGIETLRRIRERYSKSELPVIMTTAHHDSSVIVEALGLGADDFVTKPLDFPVVLARIGVQLSRKRAEDALRESEERYALAAQATNDGFWDWRLGPNTVYFATRWKAMLGYDDADIGTSPDEWFSRIHADDVARVRADLAAMLEGSSVSFESEHRVLHKDGHYIWVSSRALAVRDAAGRPQRIVGSQADITEGKVADALTGLPNRLLFMDRLTRCIYRKRRNPAFHYAVLFLDLDGFKDVNDSLGHIAGDELLVAVGRRLETGVRAGDTVGRIGKPHTVARFGGDEFTILLEDLRDPNDALMVAERVQSALVQAVDVAGHEVFTTASIGVVLDTNGYERPEDLLRDADAAMYKAKASGRTRYAVFDAALREMAVERLLLGTDLKKAIDRDEFTTYYQPIVSLSDGSLVGFEALVRWNHARRGIVSPGDFIHVAEETGLIVRLGQQVLARSCADLRDWQTRYPHAERLVVSVNLSGKELMQTDVVERVQTLLDAAGVKPSAIKLEITESLLMENPEAVAERLAALRSLGVLLGIDDFGTGYSSLSYLHRFPVNTLKIDRSFVSRIGPRSEDSEIIRTVVALAHNLGLDTVAEGIETTEQLVHLQALGCEYGQGFLFAKPLHRDDTERLIASNPVWAPSGVFASKAS
jgi:diguanylate cyclase (GGDEF)-like protein/PAS domain S-box-containing protein